MARLSRLQLSFATRLLREPPQTAKLQSLQASRALRKTGDDLLPIPSSSETTTSGLPREENKLSRPDGFAACVGLGILVPVILRFLFAAPIKSYARFVFRQDVVLAVAFIAAVCLEPALTYVVRSMQKQWRNTYTYGALLGTCAFLWVFILHFGRQQYGSWDFNILVETGWRQIQGQRPYVDFPATTPPGFNLGIQSRIRCSVSTGTRTSILTRSLLVLRSCGCTG